MFVLTFDPVETSQIIKGYLIYLEPEREVVVLDQ
jgi:hypothetical protein